jgi:tripartite-type tricarboxylate transporter receptor subunit TctC
MRFAACWRKNSFCVEPGWQQPGIPRKPDPASSQEGHRMKALIHRPLALLLIAAAAPFAAAQPSAAPAPCPDKNVLYWQAFPPGGESDLSARHQQLVLKKKCAAVDTIIQYKAGAGGGLMWSQMNQLPGDGANVVGINLPHIVFQPIEGEVQYKTADITPVYWFHFTPDVLVVPESSPYRSFADFIAAAKASPGRMNLGGSGLNSANHASHERLNAAFGIKSTYVPYKGTGDMALAVVGGQIDGAVTYTPFAINNKAKVRALAVAMEKRHPLMPDVPTFRELGVDWVDGAYRGIGMPKSTPPEARRKMSDLWATLNTDAEMKDLAARNGFELVNIGLPQMDGFMAERTRVYVEGARRLGLGKK